MSEKMQTYRKLNLKKIESRITKAISTEEALKDVEPMDWSDEVLSGQQQVNITRRK